MPTAAPRILVWVDFDGYGRMLLGGILRWARSHERWDFRIVSWGETVADGGDLAGVAGVIGLLRSETLIARIRAASVPVVNCSMVGAGADLPCVGSDYAAEARLAIDHLRLRGLARFAFIANGATGYALGREAAVKALVGATFGYTAIGLDADGDGDRLRVELAHRLPTLSFPVGVICANDSTARQVAIVAAEIGLAIPGALAVVGIGNDQLCYELTEPALTSVQVDGDGIGHAAAGVLAELMAGGRHGPLRSALPPLGLVVRSSSDHAACADPVVAGVVSEVRARPAAHWDVDALSVLAGCSRRTLERRCEAALGCGVATAVRRLRLEAAESLILQGRLTLAAVAGRAGFGSARRLAEAMHAVHGHSPQGWRARMLGNQD